MANLKLKNRQGTPITDWRDWTPPKDAKHWKAGRSAMELARAWFTSSTPQCPLEVEALLASHPATSGIEFTEGVPEFISGLPGGSGGRNHDLLLRGRSASGPIIVSVEGKANETFGNQCVGRYYRNALASTKPTTAHKRIELLLQMMFAPGARPDQAPWSNIPYQLLSGVAATAVQAAREDCPIGIFILHEFHTTLVTARKVSANAAAYTAFLEALLGIPQSSIHDGQIYGPKLMGPSRILPQQVALYLGKAVYTWPKTVTSQRPRATSAPTSPPAARRASRPAP
jgi:hypothetical protein